MLKPRKKPAARPDKAQEVALIPEQEVRALRRELERLNNHRFVRTHNSAWRLMQFQFLRGLAFGLGSVMGATLLVSLLVFLMSNINFIPIFGEWAAQIAAEMTGRD